MKKDMGGAAHALALAGLVMANHLKIRLHLVIPTVENAIAGNAFRPGDVLRSRKGLTVENTNTDAEGRLILGDALTKAGEFDPELIRSEEHTSELQSLMRISYAVFCLKKKKIHTNNNDNIKRKHIK